MQTNSSSNDAFHLVFNHLPDSTKARSGDYCAYTFIASENTLVLTLADGVGSNVCDWKASEVACNTFMAHFTTLGETSEMVERFQIAVRAANAEILNEVGHCKGMKTTFLAVVWNFRRGKILYTSIGDSRIYHIANDSLTQLTKDETTSIIRKGIDGKPLVFAGMTVTGEAVNNLLGALVSFEVHEMEDANLDGLLLASDGFYNCQPSLSQDTVEIMNSANLETPFQKVIQRYRQYQTDDMTAIFVRKKGQNCEWNEHLLKEVLEGVSKAPKYNKMMLLSVGLPAST